MNAKSLQTEALRRYEAGRALNGAWLAGLVAAPFACASLACFRFPGTTMVLGVVLAAVVFWSRHRGLWLSRGLYAGLLAGSLGVPYLPMRYLGGTLEVQSQPGQGTSVSLELRVPQ